MGNRKINIKLALQKINALKDTRVVKISNIIQTNPVGGPRGQGKFLNAALKIETKFSPINLLKKLKTIEKELGRTKTVRFGPRVIDLDILLYADKIINRKDLKIPHPRMWQRDFVLEPLSQIL